MINTHENIYNNNEKSTRLHIHPQLYRKQKYYPIPTTESPKIIAIINHS
jgi:hypothetical protein